MNIRVVSILAVTVLAACTTGPPVASEELYDEESAATLLVASEPLVFARERSDVAAHAHDYATLVAVELDIAGEYSQFLLLYRWSTVDRRMLPPPGEDAGALRIVADGRTINLPPLERMPVSLKQRRALHVPDHGDVAPHAYKIDVATLHFIATSGEIFVRMPQEQLDTPFKLREDGRGSLQQFLKRAVAP